MAHTPFYPDGPLRTDWPPEAARTTWMKDGVMHRVGAPAVEWDDGFRQWYKFGRPHRLDGPAYELVHGDRQWYVYGTRHRDNDQPAWTRTTGSCAWFVRGLLHRDNGPAVICVAGDAFDPGSAGVTPARVGRREWWCNDVRHRGPMEGHPADYRWSNIRPALPAVVYDDGREEFWDMGRLIYPRRVVHEHSGRVYRNSDPPSAYMTNTVLPSAQWPPPWPDPYGPWGIEARAGAAQAQ